MQKLPDFVPAFSHHLKPVMRDGSQFTYMLFHPRIDGGIPLDGAVESQQSEFFSMRPRFRRWSPGIGGCGCDVVYCSDQAMLIKPDLKVRVGIKETVDPTLCYCFDDSRDDIRRDLETTGTTSILEDIKADVQGGFCACGVKNLSGACCLGDLTRGIQEANERAAGTLPSRQDHLRQFVVDGMSRDDVRTTRTSVSSLNSGPMQMNAVANPAVPEYRVLDHFGRLLADQNCVREVCSADFRVSCARRCAETQMTHRRINL